MFFDIPPTNAQDSKAITAADTPGNAITVEAINDIWFLLLALVAVIAYCVRIELGVKDVEKRVTKVEDESIPSLRRETKEMEIDIEKTMIEARRTCGGEFNAAIESQREFILGQTAVILEKISNIKEQSDRQGAELRELRGYLRVKEKGLGD